MAVSLGLLGDDLASVIAVMTLLLACLEEISVWLGLAARLPAEALNWTAANGGVTIKWGLKGCLPAALPGNRLKSAFFALFLPFCAFPGGTKSTREVQKTEGRGLFPQMRIRLNPPSLKPPFAALQLKPALHYVRIRPCPPKKCVSLFPLSCLAKIVSQRQGRGW